MFSRKMRCLESRVFLQIGDFETPTLALEPLPLMPMAGLVTSVFWLKLTFSSIAIMGFWKALIFNWNQGFSCKYRVLNRPSASTHSTYSLLPSFEIVKIFALCAKYCKYEVFNEMWETVQIWGFESPIRLEPPYSLLPSFKIVKIFALRAKHCKYEVFNEM